MPFQGALTLFFRWRKKSVQKKASGTATPEAARPAARRGLRPAGALRAVLGLGSLCSPAGTKALIAHFDGGARYVARSRVGQLTHAIVRARSSPFSAAKMGGPFSLRCLSPLCSPRSWRRAGLSLAGWDDSRGLAVLQRQGMRGLLPCVHGLNDLECERPAWFRSHAGLYCEP